jgi:hypothetical protein
VQSIAKMLNRITETSASEKAAKMGCMITPNVQSSGTRDQMT